MEPGEPEELQVFAKIVINMIYCYSIGVGGCAHDVKCLDPVLLDACLVALRLFQAKYGIQEAKYWSSSYTHDHAHTKTDSKTSIMNSQEKGEGLAEWLAHTAISKFASTACDGRTDIITRPWLRFAVSRIVNDMITEPVLHKVHQRLPPASPMLFFSCCFENLFRANDIVAMSIQAPTLVVFASDDETSSGICACVFTTKEWARPYPICVCGAHSDNDMSRCHTACQVNQIHQQNSDLARQKLFADVFRETLKRLERVYVENEDFYLEDPHNDTLAEIAGLACGLAFCAKHPKDRLITRAMVQVLHPLVLLRTSLQSQLGRTDQYNAVFSLTGDAMGGLRDLHQALESPSNADVSVSCVTVMVMHSTVCHTVPS